MSRKKQHEARVDSIVAEAMGELRCSEAEAREIVTNVAVIIGMRRESARLLKAAKRLRRLLALVDPRAARAYSDNMPAVIEAVASCLERTERLNTRTELRINALRLSAEN